MLSGALLSPEPMLTFALNDGTPACAEIVAYWYEFEKNYKKFKN